MPDNKREKLNSEPSALANRIAVLVEKYPSQQAAAVEAGVSLSQLKRYLSGENEPSLSAAAKLAKGANVSLDWLAFGLPSDHHKGWGDFALMEVPPADNGTLPDNWAAIPVFENWAAAGSGRVNEQNAVGYYIAAEESWVMKTLNTSSKTLSGVFVAGDSMEPTLRDNDIVIIDLNKGRDIKSDGIYALMIDDLFFIKRLSRRSDGKISIMSDNPRYHEEIIDPTAVSIRIYGKAVATFHRL